MSAEAIAMLEEKRKNRRGADSERVIKSSMKRRSNKESRKRFGKQKRDAKRKRKVTT